MITLTNLNLSFTFESVRVLFCFVLFFKYQCPCFTPKLAIKSDCRMGPGFYTLKNSNMQPGLRITHHLNFMFVEQSGD